jgi:hypothetical protein
MAQPPTPRAWERYAWAAGIVFVVALAAESVISTGVGLTHQDSAAKIASHLHDHRERLLLVAYLSVIYAVAFVVYLWKLYRLLAEGDTRGLSILVLVGGVLFVTLHAVSDIGITGLLGAKVASYGDLHDRGTPFTLYYMTFALDSVGDVFASLFFAAAGLLVFASGVLPRWLGWVAVGAALMLFLQGFGLGGVIGTFGLVLDLIGFVLLLVFVAASSVILLRRGDALALRPPE